MKRQGKVCKVGEWEAERTDLGILFCCALLGIEGRDSPHVAQSFLSDCICSCIARVDSRAELQ